VFVDHESLNAIEYVGRGYDAVLSVRDVSSSTPTPTGVRPRPPRGTGGAERGP
jgi:hypothetical protein